MTNQEIIDKIDNLLSKKMNYCDFELEIVKLEKEYKKSNFYKETKLSLEELITKYRAEKIFNFFDIDKLFIKLQEKIEELDVDNVLSVLDKLQDVLSSDYNNNSELFNKFTSLIHKGD